MTSWLRRQRLALLLLPLALVLALAGSGRNLEEYWWNRGMHQPVRADLGELVAFADEYDDGYLRYRIHGEVRVDGVERVTHLPDVFGEPRPVDIPDGTAVWRVDLHVEADPDAVLTGCRLAVFDADERRFDYNALDVRGASGSSSPCVPADTPGPQYPLWEKDAKPELAPGEDPRPARYDTSVLVLTAADAVPERVHLWWYLPRYVEVDVSG